MRFFEPMELVLSGGIGQKCCLLARRARGRFGNARDSALSLLLPSTSWVVLQEFHNFFFRLVVVAVNVVDERLLSAIT